MKLKPIVLIFVFLSLISSASIAQKRKKSNGDDSKYYEKIGLKVTPEYTEAEQLAVEAKESLLTGDVKLAELTIKKSIQLYPTTAVFDYALALAALPDMVACNEVMDLAIEAVKLTPLTTIIWRNTIAEGKHELRQGSRQSVYYFFLEHANLVNSYFGNRKWIEFSLSRLANYQSNNTGGLFSQLSSLNETQHKISYLSFLGKNQEAINYIDRLTDPISQGMKWYWKTEIYFKMNDPVSMEREMTAVGNQTAVGKWFGFLTNFLKKDFAAARKMYNQIDKISKAKYDYYFDYYNGLIALYEGKHDVAVQSLESSIYKQDRETLRGYYFVDKWKKYKELGDAYIGIKQYEKARNNYNIALLYYPEYEPAITALANLESDIAKQTSADRSPPVISLLEPSPKRGLILTSTENNVMVKGFAMDPSGIKAVTINGQTVYSQPGGDFWGEVDLKNGINKILIAATDAAGNKSQQVFEIEKKSGESNAQKPEKEGKNYALLIAAQNYTDHNIPSLDNPVADAVKLKLILKNNYNYAESNIITLFNPEGNDVKRQLLELTNTILPEDNLVIFYAGHGIWVEKEKKGYWMLIDAKLDDANTWLPNKEVLDLIAKLPSRHTLLITDACFSGSVFKTRGLNTDMPVAVRQMNEKISRVAITSGNDTEVPDKSVFMKYLVKALSENKEKYLTAQKMFINQIIEAVMTETKTEPRYGTLELAGHVGGDYIFMRK